MKILVHICCGPCAITLLEDVLAQGLEPTAFFYNPNIHGLLEYIKRSESAMDLCKRLNVPFVLADRLDSELKESLRLAGPKEYIKASFVGSAIEKKEVLPFLPKMSMEASPLGWLELIQWYKTQRCFACWHTRLAASFVYAKMHGVSLVTSSLLYSKYQDHAQLQAIGSGLAASMGLEWYYKDYRESWQRGIDLSKEYELYRQPYCGCFFSEYERYEKKRKKLLAQNSC